MFVCPVSGPNHAAYLLSVNAQLFHNADAVCPHPDGGRVFPEICAPALVNGDTKLGVLAEERRRRKAFDSSAYDGDAESRNVCCVVGHLGEFQIINQYSVQGNKFQAFVWVSEQVLLPQPIE